MSFDHLIRIGRRWVNPWFVVEIEESPPPDEGSLVVTVIPGRSWRVDGDDARKLRAMLPAGEGGSLSPPTNQHPPWPPPAPTGGPPADEGPPAVESGTSDRPLVRSGHLVQAGEVME